jgi:hypothetical protein
VTVTRILRLLRVVLVVRTINISAKVPALRRNLHVLAPRLISEHRFHQSESSLSDKSCMVYPLFASGQQKVQSFRLWGGNNSAHCPMARLRPRRFGRRSRPGRPGKRFGAENLEKTIAHDSVEIRRRVAGDSLAQLALINGMIANRFVGAAKPRLQYDVGIMADTAD